MVIASLTKTAAAAFAAGGGGGGRASGAASSTIDDDVRAYNEYASAAVELSHAQHFPSSSPAAEDGGDDDEPTPSVSHFSVVRSVRDIDSDKRRRYLYTATVMGRSADDGEASAAATNQVVTQPPVLLGDDVQWRLVSPSGRKVAVLVREKVKDDEQQVLQIWTHGGQQLERLIPLDKKGAKHGKVAFEAGGGFGRPSWNVDETCLVYSAERNPPEASSFFETNAADGDSSGGSRKIRGGVYTLGVGKSEKWGERYDKQSPLLDLYIVNVDTGKVGRIENVPGNTDGEGRGVCSSEDPPSCGDEDADTATATTLGGYVLGQAVWSPNGDAVAYIGWDAGGGSEMPRRLGMIYCQQRPSKLYVSTVSKLLADLGKEDEATAAVEGKDKEGPAKKPELDCGFKVLTPDLRVARSPRFSPPDEDGDKKEGGRSRCQLVFLAAEKPFDTHNGCFGLHAIDWTAEGDAYVPRVVVPQVWNPLRDKVSKEDAIGEVAGLPFPGLFVAELPQNPFCSPTDLITTTQWGSCQKVVRISLSTGQVRLVRVDSATGGAGASSLESEELLCIGNDGSAFVVVRSPSKPGVILHVSNSFLLGTEGSHNKPSIFMKFRPIVSTKFSPIPGLLQLDFDVSIQSLSEVSKFDCVDDDLVVQFILMVPNKANHPKPPLIVCPHGGPHSAYTTSYFHSLSYLCGGGYAILIPNYRGSTGFGQASIEALPTRIGDMDVKDVIAATNQVKKSGLVDADRIAISGGSHGGFLTAHCTSQFPDLFKAASTRNPVVNIASMITATGTY